MQEAIRLDISTALAELSCAARLLDETPDVDNTTQIDDVLEELIFKQNEVAAKYESWARESGGGSRRTTRLGVTQGTARAATQRCPHLTLCCAQHVCNAESSMCSSVALCTPCTGVPRSL